MDSLRQILLENPNRSKSVPAITLSVVSDTQEGDGAPETICGWVPTPLEPPGPLAVLLWKTNPEFRAGTPPVRRTILREAILKLQERVEAELRGHRWSRKKIMEQLAAQQSADASPPQDTKDLDAAIAHLHEVQFVVVDEANKKIRWVPEDPRTWSPDRPVWGISLGSRAVYHNKNETPVSNHLSQWLSERDNSGWKIDWPVAEGTLEAIKAALLRLNTGLGPRMEKPKKADYAAVLGRTEAIRFFAQHFSGESAGEAMI